VSFPIFYFLFIPYVPPFRSRALLPGGRNPSRIDAKRRGSFLHADFLLLIRPTSSNPRLARTSHALSYLFVGTPALLRSKFSLTPAGAKKHRPGQLCVIVGRLLKSLGCAVVEQRMPQFHRITILIPLVVGACVVACTIFIHALAVGATVSFVRYEKKLGRVGVGFWIDVAIVASAMSVALLAHLIEIGLWAVLFVICGEFPELGTAYYHSAVNYTTLGYGDLIMTPSWRLLGPLEAANGMLMFGVSTAIIFAVIQRLIQARFADLRD
jgi:hypothetical protein